MKKTTLLLTLFSLGITGCTLSQEQPKTDTVITKRDTTITPQNAFSTLFVDSTTVEQFIKKNNLNDNEADQLRSFYNSRNYQFAWFEPNGLASQTAAFWNLHQNYLDYSKDHSLQDQWLHQQMKQLLEKDTLNVYPNDSTLIRTELELTEHFFEYAKNAYTGTIDPQELQWFIPRKKINVVNLLDSLIATKGKNLQDWEPVNPQYDLMKKELLHLYKIQKAGGWPVIDTSKKKVYKMGDHDAVIPTIKKRLQLSDDMAPGDSSPAFDIELFSAVQRAQHRFGITEDGVIGPATIRRLNVPLEDRIQQLMVNMERMRWLPKAPSGNFIIVNIPEFAMHVYDNHKEQFKINVVVGKAGHNTQVFSDTLKYVVFSPYWNVPSSIVKNEILPAIQKNPGYLEENNMEITGYANGLPIIRQKPGPDNALGKVKFIFPNNYNIYFHDTPAKTLFDNNNRAFSHGCIRLEYPYQLASYLLRNQPQWTDEAIWNAMYSDKEKWVKLKKSVPVQITYFTAWVDNDGILNYREDIYGHDTATAQKLFQYTSLGN